MVRRSVPSALLVPLLIGLGVLIFQLLMEGNHPFRAQWLGQNDPPPVEDRLRGLALDRADPG